MGVMIRVWIPSYHQIVNKDLGKSYTVYRVEVTTLDGRYFDSEKRYSGFHDLYIKCRERYNLNTNFPPKKLSNSTAKVLDSRRAGLEIFLQSLASFDPIPAELMEFLDLQDITINPHNMSSGDFETAVFQVLTDYKQDSRDNNDVIIQSALQAFYGEEIE